MLTVSQAFELMKIVIKTLAGRMAIVELKGMSLREIHHVPFYKPFIPNEAYITSSFVLLKLVLYETIILFRMSLLFAFSLRNSLYQYIASSK